MSILRIDLSPHLIREQKNSRVLEWVRSSFHDSVQPTSCKRKLLSDSTNASINTQSRKFRKLEHQEDFSDLKLPSSKFYNGVRKSVEVSHLPSTPESKQSKASADSLSLVLNNMDVVLIGKARNKQNTSEPVLTDSESMQSTPVKKQLTPKTNKNKYILSSGLDSSFCSDTPKVSSIKKFTKLGHRTQDKTPLQLYKESISTSSKKLNRSGSRPKKLSNNQSTLLEFTNKSNKDVSQSEIISASLEAATPELPVDQMTPSSIDFQPSPKTGSVNPTPVTAERHKECSNNDMDKTNTTLLDESLSVQKKLLPLFKSAAAFGKKTGDNDNKEQMVIDAGQDDLDEAKQCPTCRMIYCKGDPNDETLHNQFHSQLTQALKFPGWKKENIAVRGADHRIIYIDSTDPPYCLKKVDALKAILDRELGFVPESSMLTPSRRLYLYVGNDKHIKGVCLVESISQANRLIGDRVGRENVPAYIGVNRLWVYAKNRREGVATKILDIVRSTYGMGICVPRNEIAFSDPTSHGKSFAERYTGTSNFLVYKP